MNTGEQLRDMQKAFAEPLMKRIKELEAELAALKDVQQEQKCDFCNGSGLVMDTECGACSNTTKPAGDGEMGEIKRYLSDFMTSTDYPMGSIRQCRVVREEDYDALRAELAALKAKAGWQLVGYARKDELTPLLSEAPIDGKHIRIGLDHPICWADEPPYEWLTPLYVATAPKEWSNE